VTLYLHKENYERLKEILDTIPGDMSVSQFFDMQIERSLPMFETLYSAYAEKSLKGFLEFFDSVDDMMFDTMNSQDRKDARQIIRTKLAGKSDERS